MSPTPARSGGEAVFASKLLSRQLRRHLALDGEGSLQSLADALQRASAAEPALAGLAQGLPTMLAGVAESYTQYERDLELRARSMELSSAELLEANERLHQEALSQRAVLDALRLTARELTSDALGAEQAVQPAGDDLLSLAQVMRGLAAQRRASEWAAQRARSQLERAIAALDAGFAMYDEHERLLVWNQRFAEMYGEAGRLLHAGMPLRAVLEAVYDSGVEGIDRSVAREAWIDERLQMKRRGGTRETHINGRWIRIVESLTEDRLMVTLRTDITDMRELADSLTLARDAAQAANQAKSQFLANMSHEIRTPMNGVIGMTALALDTDLTPEQREYLGMVKTSADSLLVIINDILDFSKMEAGMLRVDSVGFSLDALLGDTLKALGVRAFGKGLELLYRRLPGVPDRLVGDPGRLRQIINNLVGNSIKFTENGEVSVQVEPVDISAERARLRFVVSDTGIGIAADKQADIFAAFSQADNSITRRFGGTGLGLAICSRLVGLMQGRIGVESEPGQGSRFIFEVELGCDEVPAVQRNTQIKGRSVLVVDDNATHCAWLSGLLTEWGLKVRTVVGGQVGYELLRSGNDAFDAVLLDAQMPGVDGFELLGKLRDRSGLAASTVMMLSADNLLSDVARCKTLGVAGYMSKPVSGSELLDGLLSALGTQVEPALAEPPRTGAAKLPTAQRSLDLLLVEDNQINQTLATFLLERLGHKVSVAVNGRIAVDMTAEHPFDLVLMDMQMPEMDGLEATRCIRERELKAAAGHVPIMAMTANAMQGDRERCIDAGMDGYVSKPIDPASLSLEIERLMAAHAAAEAARKQAAGGTLAAEVRPEDVQHFDLATMVQRLGSTRDNALELARLFVGDAAALLARMREATTQHDLARVETLSRRLFHASDSLSAGHVRQLAQGLMLAAKSRDEAAIAQLTAQIDQGLVRFAQALIAQSQPGGKAARTSPAAPSAQAVSA